MSDEAQMKRYLAEVAEREKQKGVAQTRKRNLGRSKPLAKESKTQAELNERWKLIRGCFLLSQLRTNGHYCCMECGLVVEHTYQLDLDHIDPRRPNNYIPGNAQLLCNARSANGTANCHDRKSGTQPQWSAS